MFIESGIGIFATTYMYTVHAHVDSGTSDSAFVHFEHAVCLPAEHQSLFGAMLVYHAQ